MNISSKYNIGEWVVLNTTPAHAYERYAKIIGVLVYEGREAHCERYYVHYHGDPKDNGYISLDEIDQSKRIVRWVYDLDGDGEWCAIVHAKTKKIDNMEDFE